MTAELLSVQHRPGQSPVNVYRYGACGHEHQTTLLSPPKECHKCRNIRFFAEDYERRRVAALARAARSAAEQAERAHTYRKAHLICALCFESRSTDALTLAEAHAAMFSQRKLYGFEEATT